MDAALVAREDLPGIPQKAGAGGREGHGWVHVPAPVLARSVWQVKKSESNRPSSNARECECESTATRWLGDGIARGEAATAGATNFAQHGPARFKPSQSLSAGFLSMQNRSLLPWCVS